MSIVSENIKYLRKVNGLTQEQFARRIGIKRSLLGAYEEGRANPNLGNLMNIAKIFGMSVDELLQNDIRKMTEAQQMPTPVPLEAVEEVAAPAPEKVRPPHNDLFAPNHTNGTAHARPVSTQTVVEPPVRSSVPPSPVTEKPHLAGDTHGFSNNPPVWQNGRKMSQTGGVQEVPRHSFGGHTGAILLVQQAQAAGYVLNYGQSGYLQQFPVISLPNLPEGDYRAFEVGADFAFPGAIVVGQRVRSWYELVDGRNYVLVMPQSGIIYRRVYSQVRIKGTLLLASDNPAIPSYEIPEKEVLEAWEARVFISAQMPEPTVSLQRLSQLVGEMQQELERMKK